MMADVLTVAWKELKEMLQQRGGSRSLRGGWLSILITVGAFGIFMPWQFGPEWVSSPMLMTFWAWIPFILAASLTADSFAGERERHTLETLLASRLSDRAILFGKIAAVVFYSFGIVVTCLLLGLVTINLAFWNGTLQLYPRLTALGAPVVGFFGSTLPAVLGVLVSLRAGSVRQAAQTLSLGFMILVFGTVYGGPFLFKLLPPETQLSLIRWAETAPVGGIVALAVAVLAGITLVLLAAAMARFQRAKLILD
jgi:ABC-2 type transport system permease protein